MSHYVNFQQQQQEPYECDILSYSNLVAAVETGASHIRYRVSSQDALRTSKIPPKWLERVNAYISFSEAFQRDCDGAKEWDEVEEAMTRLFLHTVKNEKRIYSAN